MSTQEYILQLSYVDGTDIKLNNVKHRRNAAI
jgi:hypothetical protein